MSALRLQEQLNNLSNGEENHDVVKRRPTSSRRPFGKLTNTPSKVKVSLHVDCWQVSLNWKPRQMDLQTVITVFYRSFLLQLERKLYTYPYLQIFFGHSRILYAGAPCDWRSGGALRSPNKRKSCLSKIECRGNLRLFTLSVLCHDLINFRMQPSHNYFLWKQSDQQQTLNQQLSIYNYIHHDCLDPRTPWH